MPRLIWLIIYILSYGTIFTQNQRSFLFDIDNKVNQALNIIKIKGGYIQSGVTSCINQFEGCTSIIRIDDSGVKNWNNVYLANKEHGSWFGDSPSLFIQNNTIYTTFQGVSSNQKAMPCIIQVNLNGDSINLDCYSYIDHHEVPLYLSQTNDSTIIIAGHTKDANNNTDAFIKNVSTVGQLLWERYDGFKNIYDNPGRPLVLSDSNIMITYTGKLKDSSINLDQYTYVLKKIDKAGKDIWSRSYYEMDRLDIWRTPHIAHRPGGKFYYVCSEWQEINNWMYRVFKVLGLDNDGNVEWEVEPSSYLKPYEQPYSVITMQNGDLLIIGNDIVDNKYETGMLTRISPQGVIKWKRRLTAPGFEEKPNGFFYTAIEEPNGGITVTGYLRVFRDGLHEADFWLLKLDSTGCFHPGCTGYDDEVDNTTDLSPVILDVEHYHIYPNPAKDYINISIPESLFKNKTPKLIEIIDPMGRSVMQINNATSYELVDISSLPSGLYMFKIYQQNTFMHSMQFIKM